MWRATQMCSGSGRTGRQPAAFRHTHTLHQGGMASGAPSRWAQTPHTTTTCTTATHNAHRRAARVTDRCPGSSKSQSGPHLHLHRHAARSHSAFIRPDYARAAAQSRASGRWRARPVRVRQHREGVEAQQRPMNVVEWGCSVAEHLDHQETGRHHRSPNASERGERPNDRSQYLVLLAPNETRTRDPHVRATKVDLWTQNE